MDSIVTIIGSSYFQPISDLISNLFSNKNIGNNDVQSSSFENGYSTSIILLLIAMFESYTVRVRYFHKDNPAANEKYLRKFISKVYPDFKKLQELEEIYIIRDIIIHNHLWELKIKYDKNWNLSLENATKSDFSGDKKYMKNVDLKKRKTKLLNFNINPILISRKDLIIVFEIVWESLLFFESKNRNQCYVSHIPVLFNGKSLKFGDLILKIKN